MTLVWPESALSQQRHLQCLRVLSGLGIFWEEKPLFPNVSAKATHISSGHPSSRIASFIISTLPSVPLMRLTTS